MQCKNCSSISFIKKDLIYICTNCNRKYVKLYNNIYDYKYIVKLKIFIRRFIQHRSKIEKRLVNLDKMEYNKQIDYTLELFETAQNYLKNHNEDIDWFTFVLLCLDIIYETNDLSFLNQIAGIHQIKTTLFYSAAPLAIKKIKSKQRQIKHDRDAIDRSQYNNVTIAPGLF